MYIRKSMMKNTFGKEEKLCNFSQISQLFSKETPSVKNFPLKLLYLPIETECKTAVKVLVSVPKRSIKSAVERNYLKRIIRESYRLQKQHFIIEERQFAVAFIYMSKEKTTFHDLFSAMEALSLQWKAIFSTQLIDEVQSDV